MAEYLESVEEKRISAQGVISIDSRRQHGNHAKVSKAIKERTQKHSSIPKIESHYCPNGTWMSSVTNTFKDIKQ